AAGADVEPRQRPTLHQPGPGDLALLRHAGGVAPAEPPRDSLAAVERRHVAAMLERTGWNITRAAELLEVDRVTVYNKIKKYGLAQK
ncbi:MAG: helix-turn-helix domain-containing protein, partial [Planctomycetes bacterium]|nr:helix-turn-helix domain-containing protein [Planctomycetota bacterium]